jgi:ligand-binding sensor domain-containing protein
MLMRRLITFFTVFIICLTTLHSHANEPVKPSRLITVRDGLPQSYVSSIYQDNNGFLWVSTLNGLGRYDGRGFKTYQHNSASNNGLGGNIILFIFPASGNELLICYSDGRMELFNTVTEKVIQLWNNPHFKIFKKETTYFKSLTSNCKGIFWMMANDGGVYRINPFGASVKHFTMADLKITEPVLGMAIQNGNLVLLTETHLFVCDSSSRIINRVTYPFKFITKYKANSYNIYSPAVRANGDFIITDATGMKVWNPTNGFFLQTGVVRQNAPGKLISAFDISGNYFFEYNSGLYILRKDNSIIQWSPGMPSLKGLPTSMFTDKSGVLWVGTNGFGLRQYNLLKTGLPGYENNYSFPSDILTFYKITPAKVNSTFLHNSVPYSNRSATFKDSVWITDAFHWTANSQLILFTGGNMSVKTFRNQNTVDRNDIHAVKFMAFDKQGGLWGIDQSLRLMQFDTKSLSFKMLPKFTSDQNEDINGMVWDSGNSFYVSTTKNLLKLNALTGQTEKLTAQLPSKDLLNISADPDNSAILWIGTLSDGLIRFNKHTKKAQVYNISTGLPNNTIYSILPGKDSLLWCSSNKGVFAFNKKNQTVRSFTSRDGLIDDEFNRYYYMQLPGGTLAFGGPLGYTVFNPAKLQTDTFNPQIILTDLNVINMPRFNRPVSTVTELNLRHDQNFITATFAAMQFDFPEKLQYRYMLKGLDKTWIIPGNENKASYTSLPPGSYTLILSATNTSGKWSIYTHQIKIVIAPPYWKTWWFYLCVGLAVVLIFYLILNTRIRSIKKVQAQKLQFEREAMELHALALRSRMNPHFIFNCLNSIKALIQEKHNQKAVNYLTTFATLIRKQLNNTSNEISLHNELETCKLYLQLEALRFEDRIAFEITADEDELLGQIKIPPLILQPIVENAIVHGLLPSAQGGLVKIKVYRDNNNIVCEIEDNGIGRAAAAVNNQKSSRLHQSKGIQLLEERITMHNRLNEKVSSMEIVDLFTPDNKPAGTLVIIKFNIYD